MANKLWDIISNLYGADAPKNLNNKQGEAWKKIMSENLSDVKRFKDLLWQIDHLNDSIENMRKKIATPHIFEEQSKPLKETLKNLNEELSELEKNLRKKVNKVAGDKGLNFVERDKLFKSFQAISDAKLDKISQSQKFFSDLKNIFSNGPDGVIPGIISFTKELGGLGWWFGETLERMDKLSTKLVQFNRELSLIYSSGNMLGMDIYGNGQYGSLETITSGNNINTDDFLNFFKSFDRGRVIGLTEDLKGQSESMQKLGISAAKLSKFYGVQNDVINRISGNLVFNFGTKIKDLNEVLEEGKRKAAEAGISVRKYFEQLAEASALVGDYYVQGGVKGLENLAMYAAKMDRSIGSIMDTSNRFQNFTSQYEQQNRAVALGLQATAVKVSKVWALTNIGKIGQADKEFTASLAKDMIRLNYMDKEGNIDNRAYKTLQAMDVNKEQIIQIQNMIRAYKKLGISIDEQTDINKASAVTRMKLAYYEKQNATASEKIGMIWARIKGTILDPISNILSPLFDTLLNAGVTFMDVVSNVLKPVIYGFGVLGGILTKVTNVINWMFAGISTIFESLGVKFENTNHILGKFGKIVGTLIAALITLRAATYLQARAAGMSSLFDMIPGRGKLGKLFRGGLRGMGGRTASVVGSDLTGLLGGNKIGRGILSGGKKLLSGTGKFIKGIGGKATIGKLGIGALTGMIGENIGASVGGETGNKISTVANFASMGGTIGSIFPVIGTAIGASAGAFIGAGVASWDKIKNIWSDESNNLFESIAKSFWEVFKTLWDVAVGLKDWFLDLFDWSDKEEKNASNILIGKQGYTDTSKAINKIMSNRTVEQPYAAQQAQEKLMQQTFTPTINIKQSFDGSIKARAQNR